MLYLLYLNDSPNKMPSTAPYMAPRQGVAVKGQAPEEHFPKYPANPPQMMPTAIHMPIRRMNALSIRNVLFK
jgi:hypothetical protein